MQHLVNDSYSQVLAKFNSPIANGATGANTAKSPENARGLHLRKKPQLSNGTVDHIISGNGIIERINGVIPFEGTKHLPDIKGISSAKENRVLANLVSGEWMPLIQRAGYLANRYGAAYIVLDVDDGKDVSEPIDYSRNYTIKGSFLVTHEQMQPHFELRFGYEYSSPSLFMLSTGANGQEYFHKSRVLAFYGRERTGHELQQHSGMHEPLWESCFTQFLSYLEANSAALQMLKDASVGIYKLKGLHERLASAVECDEEDEKVTESLYKRLSLMVDSVSILNKLILDMENEEYEYVERDYSGVTDILKDLRQAFIEASPLPASILFNSVESSGMFKDTSSGDRELLAMVVHRWQSEHLSPAIRKLAMIWEKNVATVIVEHHSTVHLTQKEEAGLLFETSKALVALVSAGILTPQMAARRLDTSRIKTTIGLTDEEISKISDEVLVANGHVAANPAGTHGTSEGSSN